jgi:hypothetical protein
MRKIEFFKQNKNKCIKTQYNRQYNTQYNSKNAKNQDRNYYQEQEVQEE